MNRITLALTGVFLLVFAGISFTQDTAPPADVDVAKGIQLRPTGELAIGSLIAEIAHYDTDWAETLQHDVFQPKSSPTTQPSSYTLTGQFPLSSDTFDLTERITPASGGIAYSASMSSDKPVDTKELSLQFAIPVDDFSGKKITIDQDSVTLPADPQPKGQAQLSAKNGVHEIDLPLADGTLVITGANMNIYLQDNREWDDPHYGLRIHFAPGDGQIKQSSLDLQIKVKPSGN